MVAGNAACFLNTQAFCRFDPCWAKICVRACFRGAGLVLALFAAKISVGFAPSLPNMILCVWMESGNAVALFRLCESTNAYTADLTEPPKSSTRKLCATQTCFTACLLSARTFSTTTTRAKSSALDNFQYEFRSSKHYTAAKSVDCKIRFTVVFPKMYYSRVCGNLKFAHADGVFVSLSKIRAQLAKRFTSSEAWLNAKRQPDKRHALRSYFQHTKRGQNQRQEAKCSLSIYFLYGGETQNQQQKQRLQKQKNTHTTTKKTILGLSCVAVLFVISRLRSLSFVSCLIASKAARVGRGIHLLPGLRSLRPKLE